MRALYLNGHKADIEDVVISQTKQVNDLAELKDRQVNYTNRFKLPFTPVNIELLEFLGVPGNTSRSPYERITAKLVDDGLELISNGYAKVKQTASREYEVYIYDGNVSLYEELKGERLNQLDYSAYNHNLYFHVWLQSLTNTSGYVYALGNFGPGVNPDNNFPSLNSIDLETQSPAFYKHTLWDMIFTEKGFTYSGDFFTTNTKFLSEVITPIKGSPIGTISENAAGVFITNNISDSVPVYNFPIQPLVTKVHVFDLTVVTALANITFNNTPNDNSFTVNYDGVLKINLVTLYTLTNVSAYAAGVSILINGASAGLFIVPSTGTGATMNSELIVNVNSGDEIKIRYYASNLAGPAFSFNAQVTDVILTNVTGGNVVEFENIMPAKSKIDFIKDIMQRYGLIFRSNGYNHYEFIQMQTLLNDRANAEDWSDKLVEFGTETYDLGSYAKNNYLKFNYEEGEPTNYDGNIEIDNDHLNEEKTLFTSIYKISKSDLQFNNQPVYTVPLWVDNNSVIEESETDVRLFKIKIFNGQIVVKSTVFNTDENITVDIPYLSLENVDMEYQISQNYDALGRVLNVPHVRNDYFYLAPIDVYLLNFFRLKYIKQLGQYYYLNKVSNFQKGKPVKCEMVQVITADYSGSDTGQGNNQSS